MNPHQGGGDVAALLAGLSSLAGHGPDFDLDAAPATPGELFEDWFHTAVRTGAPEPHAMTLSTLDDQGLPDARVLILKAFDRSGRWAFASSAASTKGQQLSTHPVAALTFSWPSLARSVRIRGPVAPDTAEASAADFRERSIGARAIALSGRQSATLDDPSRLDQEIAAARRQLDQRPDLIDEAWRRYWLTADSVEFWQGLSDRKHRRLRYVRRDGRWDRRRLRP